MKYDEEAVRKRIEKIAEVGRGPSYDGVFIIPGSGVDHDGAPCRHPLPSPDRGRSIDDLFEVDSETESPLDELFKKGPETDSTLPRST